MLIKMDIQKNKKESKKVTINALWFSKQLEDAVDALCRYESLRVYAKELTDAVDRIVKTAVACQYDGAYTLFKPVLEQEFGEETPYELIEEMLLDHPDIDHIEFAEGSYVLNVDESKAVSENRVLRVMTTDEVDVICNRHQEAMKTGADYRADFSNCLIVGFPFINYGITEMKFTGAVLMFCDMWDMQFERVDFSNAIIIQSTMANNEMSECRFQNTSFRDTTLVLSHCYDCDFAGSEFRYSDVSESEFCHTNLTGVTDICSKLNEADTSKAFFSDVAWRAHCWIVE